MSNKSILITGGTGFLGRRLVEKLLEQGEAVAVLTRDANKANQLFGQLVQVCTQLAELRPEQCKAVVNLAGAGIFDRLWSPSRKQELRNSRIQLTEQINSWLAGAQQRPEVLISGSAIGVYGDQGESVLVESSPSVNDFAQQLCADWEQAANKAQNLGVRVCLLRTGLVLGRGGGLLQRMLLPFRLGLGGRLGSGQQWMSWIHIDDWLAIVETLLSRPDLQGAFNACAPNPLRNVDFNRQLAGQLKRPMCLPLPAVVLKTVLGEMAGLLLASQRVVPERLLNSGYAFQFSTLDTALADLLKH